MGKAIDNLVNAFCITSALAVGGILIDRVANRPAKPQPEAQVCAADDMPSQPLDEIITNDQSDIRAAYKLGPDSDYSFLMTDAEFQDSSYISQRQMQEYFESNGFALAKPISGALFSEMVSELASKHQLNPLLLLARAQVEKSAVKKSELSEKQVRELMGYDIPDGGRRNETNLGFSRQLEESAACLRRHFDAYRQGTSIVVNYGKAKVCPANAATYALLRYTPHTVDVRLSEVGGGNDLFMAVYKGFRKELSPKSP